MRGAAVLCLGLALTAGGLSILIWAEGSLAEPTGGALLGTGLSIVAVNFLLGGLEKRVASRLQNQILDASLDELNFLANSTMSRIYTIIEEIVPDGKEAERVSKALSLETDDWMARPPRVIIPADSALHSWASSSAPRIHEMKTELRQMRGYIADSKVREIRTEIANLESSVAAAGQLLAGGKSGRGLAILVQLVNSHRRCLALKELAKSLEEKQPKANQATKRGY